MEQHRTREAGNIPFRNGRYRCIAGQWFFTLRSGQLEGPFPDQVDAEAACERYLRSLKQTN